MIWHDTGLLRIMIPVVLVHPNQQTSTDELLCVGAVYLHFTMNTYEAYNFLPVQTFHLGISTA